MNVTKLPTWDELSAKQDETLRRALVYGMSGHEELKEEAVADLKAVTDQMKAGQYR